MTDTFSFQWEGTDKPIPLWEVMRRAYDATPPAPVDADDDWTDRHGYAAEIRVLRDWLVPEEKEAPRAEFDCEPRPSYNFKTRKCDGPLGYEHGDYLRRQFKQDELNLEWKERQRFRALLTAEADRAEHKNTNN